MKRFTRSLKYVYLGLMLLFLYLPILYLIVFSFNNFAAGAGRRVSYSNLGRWNGFTFANYGTVFSGDAGKALLLTLEVAFASSMIATVIGTAAAIGINVMRKRSRNVVVSVSQLPMVNPDLVTGITFMMLFAFVNSLLANVNIKISDFGKLLIAHISFSIPYVIFSVLPRLKQSSDMLYEAALDLGCSPFQALIKAVIPDIMPGISSGFIMALTMSLDDFVVSYFVADRIQPLSVYIYSNTAHGAKGVNPAIATIIFIPLVTLLLVVNLRRLSKEREYEIQNRKVKMKK